MTMSEVPLSQTQRDAEAMRDYYEQEFSLGVVRELQLKEQVQALEARIAEQAKVIKALEETNTHLQEEAERYYEESRASAKTLGGILRVLRDNNIIEVESRDQ
jgi:uncharacterized coiled-coil protein SlyX